MPRFALRSAHTSFATLCMLLMMFSGCAEGGAPGGGDSGISRGDAAIMRADAGPPRDAGSSSCPPGRHACGGGCIDDQPNEPANGCRLGCGEACPMPAGGAAACSSMGTCTVMCVPPFRPVGDTCVCEARTCADMGFMCGAPDDGCGMTLDCGTCPMGAACTDGRCACARDDREPNESSTEARMVGMFTDDPRSGTTFSSLTLHSASDEDWFRFAVDNVRGILGDNPHIRVSLRDVPMGSDFDLGAWYVGNGSCDEAVEIMAGTADNMIGRGAVSASVGGTTETVEFLVDCTGTFSSDEDGTVWVRVHSRTFGPTCGPYTLQIEVF